MKESQAPLASTELSIFDFKVFTRPSAAEDLSSNDPLLFCDNEEVLGPKRRFESEDEHDNGGGGG